MSQQPKDLVACSNSGYEYKVFRDEGVFYCGEGDLDFGSFLSSFARWFDEEEELEWTAYGLMGLPVAVRNAVKTWLVVAKRLRIPRGVDLMIAKMICSRKGWTFKLYARGTNVSFIPRCLGKWRSLVLPFLFVILFAFFLIIEQHAIDASRCKLNSQWPVEVANLPHLRWVNVGKNRMLNVPHVIEMLPRLEYLNMSENQIVRIDVAIPAAVETLIISGNSVSSLPDISHLRNLKVLLLDANKFTLFPEALCLCHTLRQLSLDFNRVESIPTSISELVRLEWFSVKRNWLSHLPDSMGALKELRTCRLTNNLLVSLPDELSQLASLMHLDVDDNCLEALPFAFANIREDCIVNISKNDLSGLPIELRNRSVMDAEIRKYLRLGDAYEPPPPVPEPNAAVVDPPLSNCCARCCIL